jgi:hypothetical protein
MRKLLFIFCMTAMLAACGDGKNRTTDVDSNESVEENAGETVSPALEDSASMQETDSLGTELHQDDSIK